MKLLGIDLGLKRIGVAIADGKIVAASQVIEALERKQVIKKILEIIRLEDIDKIIIGIPKSNDKSGEDLVRSFALEINKMIELPVEFVDESLTSKEAERLLLPKKIDPRSEKYKKEVDKISAKLILEQYLKEND